MASNEPISSHKLSISHDNSKGNRKIVSIFSSLADAIEYGGFGLYNIALWLLYGLIVIFWANWKVNVSILGPTLVCDWDVTALMEAILTAVQNLGGVVGGLLCGWAADRIGRRLTVQISCALTLVFGAAGALAPAYGWLLVDRLLVGVAIAGLPQILNLVIEFAKRTMRAITYLSCHLFFALSIVLMSVIGLLTTPTIGWRWFLVASAAPLAISVVFTFLIPESTAFLLMSGKKAHAERLLTRMHVTNRAHPSVWLRGDPNSQPVAVEERYDARAESGSVRWSVDGAGAGADEAKGERAGLVATANERDTVELDASASAGEDDTRGNWTDLFDKQFRTTTLLTALVSFCMNFAYLCIVLGSTELVSISDTVSNATCGVNYVFCTQYCQLSRSDYLALIVASCGDLLALPLVLLLCEWLGRRFAMASTLVLFGAVAGLLALLQPIESTVLLAIHLFGARASIAGTGLVIFLYTSEVYPSNVRGQALGVVEGLAGVAGVLAPFASQWLLQTNTMVAIFVFAGVSILGGVAAACLPIETRGRPLVDTTDRRASSASLQQPPPERRNPVEQQ